MSLWKPKGTKPSKVTIDCGLEGDWDGNYFANMWQVVEDDDAKNIALALEKAFQDIPDKPNRKAHHLTRIGEGEKVSPLDYWNGKRSKAYVKQFIKYCKVGGFTLG